MPPDPLVLSALSLVQFWLLSVSVLNEQQGVFLTVWRQQLDTVQDLNLSFYIHLLKSIHFKKTVAQSLFLSKVFVMISAKMTTLLKEMRIAQLSS